MEALSSLKEQLKQQLTALEQHEKAAEENLRPQTVSQVDQLQEKLMAALEELKTRRAELAQKEKEEKQKEEKQKEPKQKEQK